MEASIKFGRLWGIPIGLHWSLFIVFGLLVWSLAQGYFPEEYPTMPNSVHWFLAVVTTLLFFRSVLLQELGHALIALRNHIPVRQITLFIYRKRPGRRCPGLRASIALHPHPSRTGNLSLRQR